MLKLNKYSTEIYIEGPLDEVVFSFVNNPRDPGRDCIAIRATKADGTVLEVELASIDPYLFEVHTEQTLTFVGQKRVLLHPKV